MNRRAAWTLVLLSSASVWAQEPSRPNFSGTWTMVRSQSRIQFPLPGVTLLRIDHKDGVFRLSYTFAEKGRSTTSDSEITTDGKETIRKESGHVFFVRGSWEGNRLVIVTRTKTDLGKSTVTQKYSLSPDGNTLAEETRFTGYLNYEETRVFRRTDGEPSPAWPRLTLKPLGWGHDDGHYGADKDILLQLAITNDQPVPVELRLRDHGKNGSQERLWSLAARITDAQGKVLTRSCCHEEDDWWSSDIAISESCLPGACEMPGDYVTLAPGQTVLRTAELNSLVWNCPALREMHRTSLPAGTYDVQLTVDGLISEPLRIVVE
jgi:hypothetical protein